MRLEQVVKPTPTPAPYRRSAMSAKLAARVVKFGLDRCRDERTRLYRSPGSLTARWARLALVWEREARWWGVLARYCDPAEPYLTAVINARIDADDLAHKYRGFVAETERAA